MELVAAAIQLLKGKLIRLICFCFYSLTYFLGIIFLADAIYILFVDNESSSLLDLHDRAGSKG